MARWRARVAEIVTAALVAGAMGVGVAAPVHALTRAPLVPILVSVRTGLWFEGSFSQVDSSQRLVVAGVETDNGHGYASTCTGVPAIGRPIWPETRLMVRRYLSDGSSDPSFGESGIAVVDLRALGVDVDSQSLAGAVVSSGGEVQMVALGYRRYCDVADPYTTYSAQTIAVAVRLLPDGHVDTALGSGGVLPLPAGSWPQRMSGSDALWVADPLGSRPIVGSSLGTDVLPFSGLEMALSGTDLAYTKFNNEPGWGAFMHPAVRVVDVSGGLSSAARAANDGLVGADGLVSMPTPGATPGGAWGQFVVVDHEGRFVVASAQFGNPDGHAIYLSRLVPGSDGSWIIDPTFGVNGATTLPNPESFSIRDMVVDNESRLVLLSTGSIGDASDSYFRLTRVTAAGSLDPEFATDGSTTMLRPQPRGVWNGADLAIDNADRPYALLPIETQISQMDSIERPPGSAVRAAETLSASAPPIVSVPTDKVRRFTVGGVLDPTWKGNQDPPVFLPAPDLRFALGKPVTVKALPGTLSWGTAAKACAQWVGGSMVSASLRTAPIQLRNGVATRQSVTMVECATGSVAEQTAIRTARLVVSPKASKGWKATASRAALGKTELTTRATGTRLVLPVVGTSATLIAAKGPGRGRFTVLLDGKRAGVVDLWAKKASAPITVWVSALKAGKHTVTVIGQGTKGRGLVGVDAIATIT